MVLWHEFVKHNDFYFIYKFAVDYLSAVSTRLCWIFHSVLLSHNAITLCVWFFFKNPRHIHAYTIKTVISLLNFLIFIVLYSVIHSKTICPNTYKSD